jgi:hypothetical protein
MGNAITPTPNASVAAADLSTMDVQTALLAVQSERANQLEAQLKDQIAAVQAKNDQIGKLNLALAALNNQSAAFPSNASASSTIAGTEQARANDYALEKAANSAMAAAGIAPNPNSLGRMEPGDPLSNSGPDRGWNSGTWYRGGICGNSTKGEVDATIQLVKGQIDNLSNTQQMDMLRLQSLTNKRNEAFDTMTNFIKKTQDSHSSIVGNLR